MGEHLLQSQRDILNAQHCVLLLFLSTLVLFVESFLYVNIVIGLQTSIWISLTICNVLMILPKVLFPFLYGLRYREISASLRSLVRIQRLHLVSPAPLPS